MTRLIETIWCIMKNSFALHRATSAAVALALAACASEPVSQDVARASAPRVVLDAEQVLLDEEVESFGAVVDPEGSAHIVAHGASSPHELVHIVVKPGGTTESSRGGSVPSGLAVNPVFDVRGDLHTLFRARDSSVHAIEKPGPWEQVRTPCVGFIANDPELSCLANAGSAQFETPLRWEFFGLGGAGAGIIIPWRVHTSKIALANLKQETKPWGVIDMDDKSSALVDTAQAVVDARGNLIVAYPTQKAADSMPVPRYVVVPRERRQPAVAQDGDLPKVLGLRGTSIGAETMAPFGGFALARNGDAEGAYLAMEVNRLTGCGSLMCTSAYRLLKIEPGSDAWLPDLPFGISELRLAVDRAGSRLMFVAAEPCGALAAKCTSLVYFELQQGVYSGFLPLGNGFSPLLLPRPQGDALAVWLKKPGRRLVARRISQAH